VRQREEGWGLLASQREKRGREARRELAAGPEANCAAPWAFARCGGGGSWLRWGMGNWALAWFPGLSPFLFIFFSKAFSN